MATIRQVSELAGVSQATVSRVVNGSSRVSHDKKLRVEKAMQTLDYQPTSIAHSSARIKTGSVGLVIPELAGPYYGNIMHSIETTLRPLGYHLVVTSGGDNIQAEQSAVDFLLSRRVDALLLYTSYLSDDDLIDLSNQNIPLVILSREIPELLDSCIDLDDEMGGLVATRHLIKLGHRKIACITGPLAKSGARARLQGYRTALEEANIIYDAKLVIEAGYTELSGIRAFEKLINRTQEFSAIFCCNDLMAIGTLGVLKEHKTQSPISVMGFDNILFSQYVSPSLSTVNYPIEKMSIEAVHLLLQKLNKQKPDVQFKFSPTLVTRESTRAYPHI
ncbi:LacI family DNA-binding transcriptional regulator [Vibrio algicola]|uniref:LacI family DNA-binding transcriptional regulator n=1 Tax=Vibrio algicola TaxID=2662262 RepID=A0A5Q0TC02_9VIBR|nr:LacI family DNA-binding transcriptional regulator [Vibrio algicola]